LECFKVAFGVAVEEYNLPNLEVQARLLLDIRLFLFLCSRALQFLNHHPSEDSMKASLRHLLAGTKRFFQRVVSYFYFAGVTASFARGTGVCFFSFHNFDFAPGKDFVQKKSHRLRREAVKQFKA